MIGPLIKAARLQRGLTLQHVADALGLLNRQQVWEWESGKVEPRFERIAQLSEVLGLDVRDLLPTRK